MSALNDNTTKIQRLIEQANALPEAPNGVDVQLTDQTTGKVYKLYVDNGKLMMKENV